MIELFKTKERRRQEALIREFAEKHYDPPEVNIFPKPCESQEALNFLEELILGPDWYSVNPLPTVQINTEVALEIASKYMRK
jgi:hypothetical protein